MCDERPSIHNSIISSSPKQNSICDGRLWRPHSAISSCKILVTGWSQDGLQTQTAWRQSTVANLPAHTYIGIYTNTHCPEHTYRLISPPTHPPSWRGMNEWIRQMNGAVKNKLSSPVLRNTWWKTVSLSNEERKKKSQTGWQRGVVTQGEGVGERQLFLHYVANCIQTPTYSAVSLTVKAPPDRQPGETHTAPSSSLLRNHKTWCLMPKIDSHFLLPSSWQLCIIERTHLVKFAIPFCQLKHIYFTFAWFLNNVQGLQYMSLVYPTVFMSFLCKD